MKSSLRWLCALGTAGAVMLAGCSNASPPAAPTVAAAVNSAGTAISNAAPAIAATATAVAPTAAAAATAVAPTVAAAATSAAPTVAAAETAVGPTVAAAATSAATPIAAASATVGAAAAGSASGSVVQVATNAKLGQILTDPQGRTLYWFAKDTSGTSNCTGNCATTWPPFSTANSSPSLPSGVPGQLATITRTGGGTQVTYDGMPLYYYSKDTAAGDTNGEGVGKVWFVVTPGTSLVTPTPSG